MKDINERINDTFTELNNMVSSFGSIPDTTDEESIVEKYHTRFKEVFGMHFAYNESELELVGGLLEELAEAAVAEYQTNFEQQHIAMAVATAREDERERIKTGLHDAMSKIKPEPMSDGDDTADWINYGMQKYEVYIIHFLNKLTTPTDADKTPNHE